jgi:hypothetical protein
MTRGITHGRLEPEPEDSPLRGCVISGGLLMVTIFPFTLPYLKILPDIQAWG